MRYVVGGVLAGCLLWLMSMVTHCINDKETLGELRVTNALQEKNIEEYKRQAKRTDDVLLQREEQRGIQDAARQKTARQLYEAKDNPREDKGQCDLDSLDCPLPDAIAMPLRLQYQTLSAGDKPRQYATANGSAPRSSAPCPAGPPHHQESGPVDK